MRQAARRTRGPRVLIRQKAQSARERVMQNFVERRVLVRARRKILIAVADRHFVPFADPRGVGVRQIRYAVRTQLHIRRRIIHHRRAMHRARGVVVLEPQRVAHFMRRQLPQPGQRHLLHLRRERLALFIRRQQRFRNHIVLPHAQRTQRHVPLDDFSRARIDYSRAIRPSARRAMHPLDHVVAQVHHVRAFRQQLHAKRIFVARGLKRLVPPARPLQQRRANRLRRAAVQVIHEGLHRVAHRRRGIFFLQPVPRHKPLHNRLADRRRVVHVLDAEEARARIVRPRLVARRRQLHKRMMLAQGDGLRRRRHLAHPRSRLVSREGERCFHFRIQREILCFWQVNRAARAVQPVRALLCASQSFGNVMRIAQEKLRRVHQRTVLFFRRHRNPHSADSANESCTARRSSGSLLTARYSRFSWISGTFGPLRSNRTMRVAPNCPRSRPMSFDPIPAGSPLWYRNSVPHLSISSHSFPCLASQYRLKYPGSVCIPAVFRGRRCLASLPNRGRAGSARLRRPRL